MQWTLLTHSRSRGMVLLLGWGRFSDIIFIWGFDGFFGPEFFIELKKSIKKVSVIIKNGDGVVVRMLNYNKE